MVRELKKEKMGLDEIIFHCVTDPCNIEFRDFMNGYHTNNNNGFSLYLEKDLVFNTRDFSLFIYENEDVNSLVEEYVKNGYLKKIGWEKLIKCNYTELEIK